MLSLAGFNCCTQWKILYRFMAMMLLTEIASSVEASQFKGAHVFPSEITVGTHEPTVAISAFDAPADSIIEINGTSIPTLITRFQSGLCNLRGIVPSSLVASVGTLSVMVISASSTAVISEPMLITVRSVEQPASLEIATSQSIVHDDEQLTLEVRLTNRGDNAFYLPTKVHPLVGGNGPATAYYLEVRHPEQKVYTDPVGIAADVATSYRPTEEQLLQSGTIAKLAPGQSFMTTVTVSVSSLKYEAGVSSVSKAAGEYSIRMRFEPRGVPGQGAFGTGFLLERLFSNALAVRILDR
jgi:hypothetical protein